MRLNVGERALIALEVTTRGLNKLATSDRILRAEAGGLSAAIITQNLGAPEILPVTVPFGVAVCVATGEVGDLAGKVTKKAILRLSRPKNK